MKYEYEILEKEQVYSGFLTVYRYRLRHRYGMARCRHVIRHGRAIGILFACARRRHA